MLEAVQESIGRDSLPVCLWQENPYRLVSLWEIVRKFNVPGLLMSLDTLNNLQAVVAKIAHRQHGGVQVPEEQIQHAQVFVGLAKEFCKEAEFKASLRLMDSFLFSLDRTGMEDLPGLRRIDASTFVTEIGHLTRTLNEELQDHRYLLVAKDRIEFLSEGFDEKILDAFPSARYDITEACGCLAVELNTAAVFHLMRAAEYGLRALAYDRRVKVRKGPLDLATWDDILKELETCERMIEGYPRTQAREAQYKFYHGAAIEFRAFKNTWRNRFFHTREAWAEEQDRDKAKSVLIHVRAFMGILATRIGEGRRTPLIWK